jgi:hypothetical protein
LEELFRARVITILVDKGLLPSERANMLRGWVHSGFNVHRSRRVHPDEREDLERLAQYIIRNPFSVEKMQVNQAGDSIIYRSAMNPKIQRNLEVFTPCDFIAAITQHPPSLKLRRTSIPKAGLPDVALAKSGTRTRCAASATSRRPRLQSSPTARPRR